MQKRSAFLAVVLTLASQGTGAAAAEGWHVFSDKMAGFSTEFPAEPRLAKGNYPTSQSARGTVPQLLYSCDMGGVTYRVGIADFTGLGTDPDRVIYEATDRAMALGRIELDIWLDVNVVHGRELVLIGDDGTRHTEALFFHKDRLYQVSVVHPATHTDPAGSSGINMFLSKFQFLNPF